jgi:hypothetical protein
LADLGRAYQAHQRPERPTSRLAQARKRWQAARKRCQSREKALHKVQARLTKTQAQCAQQQTELSQLEKRLERLEHDNRTNLAPVEIEFRLDAGFGTYENLALLIELGYEAYTKPYNYKVRSEPAIYFQERCVIFAARHRSSRRRRTSSVTPSGALICWL